MTTSMSTSVGDNFQTSLLNGKDGKELIPVFCYENQLYQHYFLWFLEHTDEKKRTWDWFRRELLPRLKTREVLIDVGTGNGELLSHFVKRFNRCIAIEPNPAFKSELESLIPRENLYQTTILDTPPSLPKADLIIESHVKYYIPPEEWEINTDRLISWLIPGGCLVEVLESEHSDFQRMRAEFLGRDYVTELQHFTITPPRVFIGCPASKILSSIFFSSRRVPNKK